MPDQSISGRPAVAAPVPASLRTMASILAGSSASKLGQLAFGDGRAAAAGPGPPATAADRKPRSPPPRAGFPGR